MWSILIDLTTLFIYTNIKSLLVHGDLYKTGLLQIQNVVENIITEDHLMKYKMTGSMSAVLIQYIIRIAGGWRNCQQGPYRSYNPGI